jgi:hypothetical protein
VNSSLRPVLPDLVTVIAIALIAYSTSNVLHEALGHGGTCVALGGNPLVLSSVHFECGGDAMSDLARRSVAAAGTVVHFIAGALALLAFKRRIRSGSLTPHTFCGSSRR